MSKTDTAVLITAYNEERNISDLLESIGEKYDVFVVDDGSTDRTVEICRQKGARVIKSPMNMGQGAAAVMGYKVVAAEGYEQVIKMDGDGQHDPAEIPAFIVKLEESGADKVVGSRVLGSDYQGAPLARRLFLRPLTHVLNLITGYKLTDSMCGYRAFRGSSLIKMVDVFDEIQELEYIASEMWIRLAQAGFKVEEVPVKLAKRKSGFSYKGLYRYAWGVISTIVRARLDISRKKTSDRRES
ncbi:hypothetical protein BVX97_00885 [bacterium E08(2017)]|nr:hypothetical protein BVX97_00885 [bacterium E08(2017)]